MQLFIDGNHLYIIERSSNPYIYYNEKHKFVFQIMPCAGVFIIFSML